MSLFGRRERREIAELNAYINRLRAQRDGFEKERDWFKSAAETGARQFSEADAANRRLGGRVLELGRRLSACAEADPEYAASLERRVDRLCRVGKRVLAAWAAEKRRADHLQRRLDDACGLNHPALDDGRHWQSTRSDTKGAMS